MRSEGFLFKPALDELYELVIMNEEPYADREWRESMNALHNIMNASLHAVQGKRYTIIKV